MENGLTAHQIAEIFSDLKEIKDEICEQSGRLQAIERNQVRHQTTLEASVERAAEDRARIKVIEGNVTLIGERVSRVEERQKVGAGILAGFQVVLATLAAWIGSTR
jgi:hypothetical protein